MKKLLITSIALILSFNCFSQTVLFHKEVKDTVLGKHGPNLKNFHHFYIGLGFLAGKPDSAGSDIIGGASTNFVFGYRYKFRISNFLAIGYDVAYNAYAFAIKQNKGKTLQDTLMHKKQTFHFNDLGLSGYVRFNYGRRGNRVGNFIDIGAYGDWTAGANNNTHDKNSIGNIVKVQTYKLKYINPINYGALLRIGFNRYVIYFNYRLSDSFKHTDKYKFSELPRATIGLQISFHK